MTHRRTIVIIGAGYAGALTAVHLLRSPLAGTLRVLLVDRRAAAGRGLAYANWDDNQLLNVPAGNMSALAGDSGHFLAFCQRLDPALNAGSFVPRRVYGDYLEQLLAEAEAAVPGVLQRLQDEAVAVHSAYPRGGYVVALRQRQRIAADQVVLALGHFGPAAPGPEAAGLAASPRYVGNPWDLPALDALPRELPVLLLGSGHTAVDALFRLSSGGPRPVLMLSRRGLLPHGHRLVPQAPAGAAFPAWLANVPPTASDLMRALRAEAALRSAAGGDWRDVMNELRQHTPALWLRLPLRERRRFVARLQPWWDIHRHRLAPAAHQRLNGLLQGGQVELLAGRLIDGADEGAEGLRVSVRCRGDGRPRELLVGGVVNCTGPQLDIHGIDSPLLRQLLATGFIRQDALKLGLEVDADLQVVGASGRAMAGLHYVGPMLKATFWEAIAVPELRGHTAALAARLLQAPVAAPRRRRAGTVARRPAHGAVRSGAAATLPA
jgi:uncharacterized NAD(P)/FAD-binding protein YdhS